MTALTDICRTPDDNPRVTDYHRVRAGRMLLDRILGTDPNAVRTLSAPTASKAGQLMSCSPVHPERSERSRRTKKNLSDKSLGGIIAEIKQMEDDGIITP